MNEYIVSQKNSFGDFNSQLYKSQSMEYCFTDFENYSERRGAEVILLIKEMINYLERKLNRE